MRHPCPPFRDSLCDGLHHVMLLHHVTPFYRASQEAITVPPRRELQENQDINKENAGDGGPPSEDSINTLLHQGYSRDRVIDALRVSRNNLKMAEDILRTFVKQNQ